MMAVRTTKSIPAVYLFRSSVRLRGCVQDHANYKHWDFAWKLTFMISTVKGFAAVTESLPRTLQTTVLSDTNAYLCELTG